MNEPELLKRQILEANSLTIRQGLFLPNENGRFTELSPEDEEFLKEFMKEMNWEASYRVYFSIPYSLTVDNNIDSRSGSSTGDITVSSSQSAARPKGSISKADNYLRDVSPQWTRKITNEWLNSKFYQVDNKLRKVWSKLAVFIENKNWAAASQALKDIFSIRSQLPRRIRLKNDCSESNVVLEFDSGINPELRTYLATLDLEVGSQTATFQLSEPPLTSRPDFAFFEMNGSDIYFFIEFKKHGLINYVDENGIKNNHEMNTIMKQASKYMISTGIDCCIISDIEVSILVQLDFETSNGYTKNVLQANGSFKIDAVVPFKHYVFHPHDTIYTFQAIVCSVAYDQKLRAGNPIQKQNVERLTALILRDTEIQVPRSGGSRGSSGSESRRSHPTFSGSSMISYTPLGAVDEQDSSSENMNLDTKINEQKSWSQYKDRMIFHFNKGDFEVLQPGGYYLNTVLKLNRAAIDRVLSYLNVPPSVSHVIIKVYDLYSSEFYSQYHELKNNYEELQSSMEGKFDTEVECYIRTNTYNESRHQGGRLRVPKMYEHGGCVIKKDGALFSFGWYLILECLEKDSDQTFSLEKATNQVKLLRSLGIQHNDIYQRNVIISHGRFNLIDFSEAQLDEIDIHGDLKNLKHVWNKNMEQSSKPQTSSRTQEGSQKQRNVDQVVDSNCSVDSDKENRTKDY